MKSVLVIFALVAFIVPLCISEDTTIVLYSGVTEETPMKLTCGDITTLGENDTLTWVYVNASDVNKTLSGPNLYLNVTDNTATGRYTCYLNGEEKISYLAAKLNAPAILNTRKSITYNEGDTNRKITCTTEGSYPDPEFTWTRRGDIEGEVPILVHSDTNPNYVIMTNGTSSVLMFYNVTFNEGANFLCYVENVAGNSTTEVLVRVKDKYAAVWPFLGIVIEVVILIAVIFLYEKHSQKAANKKDLIVHADEDEKPLNCDEGTEVRNRNGSK